MSLLPDLDRAELVGVALFAGMLLTGSAAPLAVSFAVSPDDLETGRVSLFGPCPYRARHGVPCRSCGLTRGFAALSRGDVSRARQLNSAALPLYLSAWTVAAASLAGLVWSAGRLRRPEAG